MPQGVQRMFATRNMATAGSGGPIGRLAVACCARVIALLVLFLGMEAGGAESYVLALSRTPLALPFYVAESEGFFLAEGLALNINEVIGGHRSMQQLLDGRADFATSSEAVVMFSSFQRDDFVLLASFVTSADDVKVLVRGDSGIARVEHLVGRRIATVRASASNYYLDTLLLLHGVDPNSIKRIDLQPEVMATALQGKDVDAIVPWQPFAFRAERLVEGARTLADGGFYTLSFNLLVARKHVGVRDDDLLRFLRALDRAQRFIAAEPARAQAILRVRLQLDQAYIDWLWPRYRYRLALDQSLLTTLESEARWARQEGHVTAKRSPNYLGLIHSGPLRSLSPAAVGIVE